MAIVIGTDTYISLADADTYLAGHYLSTDPKYVVWAALTDANCEAMLRKATLVIDRQPLVGFKVLHTQTLGFPRSVYTDFGWDPLNERSIIQDANWYIQTAVPDAIKYAECEIAIDLAQGTSSRADLQRQGVKSFSIGNLSENYGSGNSNALPYDARELLKQFIVGNARIV